MSLTLHQVLIANGYLIIADPAEALPLEGAIGNPRLATVVRNTMYYGYIPSLETLERLNSLNDEQLETFWKPTEKALKELTADNRKMDEFVVYQNFPQEVLEMSEGEYWIKQILMYFGFDKKLFREEKRERDPLFENVQMKVLHLADDETPAKVYESLVQNKSRWTVPQLAHVQFLSQALRVSTFQMADVGFRENGIQMVNFLLDNNPEANCIVEDATDVLRLAALRSEADIALRQKVKFKSFSRRERRFFCEILEGSKNLESDIAERQGLWKRFLRSLHPGDHGCKRVSKAYDDLYNGRLKSFAANVEAGIINANPEVLGLLQSRPGEYARRLHKLYSVFEDEAISRFIPVMERLNNSQLVKLLKYVETVNNRATFAYPPRGNWNKLQIKPNTKKPFTQEAIATLRAAAGVIIKTRLNSMLPGGVALDERACWVKLQTNDQELASYGRGTVFEIPEEMTFIRTASYWEDTGGVTWFDNGWNFFDANWNHLGACCWTDTMFSPSPRRDKRRETFAQSVARTKSQKAAIFSGDPINSKEMKGRACQMIDLYIDRLLNGGVRYAVWNILCYSKVPFSKASGEVLGTLQWGEEPQKGKLYEPGRAQMVFPMTGDNLTKYIAYIDLQERRLIYMDANLKGTVHSANGNGETLSEQMPAFVEYLNALPSVEDLLIHADVGEIPVLYSDAERELRDKQPAYVFKPENQDNSFEQLDLSKLLS